MIKVKHATTLLLALTTILSTQVYSATKEKVHKNAKFIQIELTIKQILLIADMEICYWIDMDYIQHTILLSTQKVMVLIKVMFKNIIQNKKHLINTLPKLFLMGVRNIFLHTLENGHQKSLQQNQIPTKLNH